MVDEYNDLIKGFQQELKKFEQGDVVRPLYRPHGQPLSLTVRLAVREQGYYTTHEFSHHTGTISRLQAYYEAERAAREAGWDTVAYVIDYDME